MASASDNDNADDGLITLQLEDTRSDVQMCFEVGRADAFDAVLEKYSSFKGVSLDSLKFTYNGANVDPSDSPESLGMSKQDNVIKVSLTLLALKKEEVAQACTSGSASQAIDLLSKNSELCETELTWFDSDGQELKTPPLFIAIDYGHLELVSQLLPLHKDIINTLRDGDGDYSPMHWASFAGQLDIVQLLKESGATVDEEALSLARENDHTEVAEFLLKHIDLYLGLEGDSDAIMEKACREGDAKKVKEMLEEENYDIEKWRDADGNWLAFSPMFFALKNGHLCVIQIFAERGIQMDLGQSEASAE